MNKQPLPKQNATLARLFMRHAIQHLAIARECQQKLAGNCSAMEIGYAIETALAQLAETNPEYEAALALEKGLLELGFCIRRIN